MALFGSVHENIFTKAAFNMDKNDSFQPTSSTGFVDTEIRFSPLDVISMVILIGIMFIGVIGNTLVIYIFGVKPRQQHRPVKRFEAFLILLSIVDLLSSFFVPFSFMYLTATKFQQWHFGEFGCKVIPSLLQISISISQGVLILISYERYHSLVKPFNDPISRIAIGAWMFCVFVFAMLLVSPFMSTLRIYEDHQYNMRTCVPNGQKLDVLLGSAILNLARDVSALTIMAFLGSRMNHALTKQHDNITWTRENMSQKSRKLLRTVVIVFACLNLPVDIFQVIYYIVSITGVYISPDAYKAIVILNTLLNLLQVSNSVMNVFIYSRMHNKFQVQCCIQPVSRNKESLESSYDVTETEFLHVDGRRISRHQRPQ